ncbi:MAG: site-specific DNA-methyltransferase [Methanoregulaceae archaeon]|nr:site-specific DNA-methyltransferase [Methanoregulaceae archaeon]
MNPGRIGLFTSDRGRAEGSAESPAGGPVTELIQVGGECVRKYTGEFWTAGQRRGNSIHEISYRACFKPQLPAFFISRLTEPGDVVYDPFSGRGTTVIEAALLGRGVISNDRNPLSIILTRPRLKPPTLDDIADRLEKIPVSREAEYGVDLSMFFHRDTLAEILDLRRYLSDRSESGKEDQIDSWIRMVATNRLTGHSRGFFSVYTLPPNQAVSPERQRKLNERRSQTPEYRDTHSLILTKSRSLVRNLSATEREMLEKTSRDAVFLSCDARSTPCIPEDSVMLTVTSPPFLDVVQYRLDNWLRCWFNMLDSDLIGNQITVTRSVQDWTGVMTQVFRELHRITRPGGAVAFEVGEVRKGTIRLDEYVVPLGTAAGFSCEGILINRQRFTKTSNIWGIGNNRAGTNTNRIVLFRKSFRINHQEEIESPEEKTGLK